MMVDLVSDHQRHLIFEIHTKKDLLVDAKDENDLNNDDRNK